MDPITTSVTVCADVGFHTCGRAREVLVYWANDLMHEELVRLTSEGGGGWIMPPGWVFWLEQLVGVEKTILG